MRRSRVALTALLALVCCLMSPAASLAEACGEGKVLEVCGNDDAGAYAGLLGLDEVMNLPLYPGDRGGPGQGKGPRFEYASLPDCDANHPSAPSEVLCFRALRQCPPELEGSTRLRIWVRTVDPPNRPTAWQSRGVTCYSDVAPGARPRLTLADLKEAFMRTPWAGPQISTQPKGEVTLVNLTTFYRVTWSERGFEPGEQDPRTLRGIEVVLRPKLLGFTYDFGDGSVFGPTRSLGGVYPDGDVVHTYRRPGTFTTRVVTTFGADYSLDGGRTWDTMPAQVDVPGPMTTVTVKQARAVLVTS